MEEWKQALGIEDPRWVGIGKYIAEVTRGALEQQHKTVSDLTNHLRDVGNQYIEPEYVEEYLSGKASFGCFFRQLRDFLGINATDVFRNVSQEKSQQHLKSLDDYLCDVSNPESLVILLKYQPGKELREFVADLLRKKREAAINEPYHTIELGLDPEEETNRYMENRRELFKFIKDCLSLKGPLELLPSPNIDTKALVPLQDPTKTLYDGIIERMQKMHRDSPNAADIIPGSRVIVQPAYKRGKVGVTIDFLYPDGDYFDRLIADGPEDMRFFEDYWIGLEAWREAYTKGTFSTIGPDDTQKLSNLMAALKGGVNEFVPTREPTEAERYEIHQRWVWQGGSFMPGQHIKGHGEVARQMANRPDPTKRSEFEETSYRINSGLTMMIGLYEKLPDLVKDGPLPMIFFINLFAYYAAVFK